MDINALLQMLHGGGPSLQGGSGGISAPVPAQMASPSLQMPQFPGAGTNAGPQMAAQAARQALSAQPQQQSPMGGMMGSSNPMMMAMMANKMGAGGGDSGLLGLMGLNKPPTANVSFPDARGNPMQSTVSAPMPDLGAAGGGIHGMFHRIFG